MVVKLAARSTYELKRDAKITGEKTAQYKG